MVINARSPQRLLIYKELTVCQVFSMLGVLHGLAVHESHGESSLHKKSGFSFQGAAEGLVKRWWGQDGICGTWLILRIFQDPLL